MMRASYLLLCCLLLAGSASIEQARDRSALEGLSPGEIVSLHYRAKRENDTELWLLTLAPDRARSNYSFQQRGEEVGYGVICLEVEAVYELEGAEMERQAAYLHKNERYAGIPAENLAVVVITFTAEYDGSLVPDDPGTQTWGYVLSRDSAQAPWQIEDWGYGGGLDLDRYHQLTLAEKPRLAEP